MSASHLWQCIRSRVLNVSKRDTGFTLIEVIVSLTMFVTFSTAATFAVVNSSAAANTTRNRVAAANIAQGDLEQARAMPTPASTSYTATAGDNGAKYDVSRTVTMPTPSGDTTCPAGQLIKISVTVSWPGNRSVRTDTVRSC